MTKAARLRKVGNGGWASYAVRRVWRKQSGRRITAVDGEARRADEVCFEEGGAGGEREREREGKAAAHGGGA